MATQQPNVLLCGGPLHDAPLDLRVRHVEDAAGAVIKIFMGNRYEHFHSADEVVTVDGTDLAVLSWSHSTYVAE
jgi:hypothetical protein